MKMIDAKELDVVIEESFSLLGKVLDESNSFNRESNYRDAFICRHARSINSLGQDVLFLLESGRLDSCQCIVRSVLESLFKLVAAVKQSDAAIQILISEVEADAERMRLLDPIECAPGIAYIENFAAELRREHKIISKKKWSVFECASAADLVDKYRGEYFVFSGRVHANIGGIIMQENKIGAGQALQTLLFVVIYAAGGFVQIIQTKTPQAHIDESARLINRLLDLMKSGIFKELDVDLNEG
jgi:hypothetical protein